MYTEVTQTQQSSNGDKHHIKGAPTYATVSKASKRRTDGNKHNQGMQIHDNNEANKHLMLHLHLKHHHVILIHTVNTKTTVGSNSQMHHYQQEPEGAENYSNYSLLGIEESNGHNITGRLAETNDDYADPDEEGEGWGQDSENVYHVLEGPAPAEGQGEGPTQDEAMVYEVPIASKPLKNN